IEFGDIYDDLTLPFTISVWVYVEPHGGALHPIFTTQDNSVAYYGFDFLTSTTPHVGIQYGDGRGGNHPNYRRARVGYFAEQERWVHLAAVARSGNDMQTYLNGYPIDGPYHGNSPYPMNSYAP